MHPSPTLPTPTPPTSVLDAAESSPATSAPASTFPELAPDIPVVPDLDKGLHELRLQQRRRSSPTPEECNEMLRLHLVEGWSVGNIASSLERHHQTVSGVLTTEGPLAVKLATRAHKVDPYLPFIREVLGKYPKVRSSRIWGMLKTRGYTGSSSGIRAVVKQLRPRPTAEAFLRRSVLPGQEAQVDWAHFGKVRIGSAERTLFAFVMVCSFSRKRFVRFSLSSAMPSFLRGHVEAFRYFGAVPRVLLFDNLKSAVIERVHDAIRYNTHMLELARHYRFEPRPCAPYRPNEKGRVERAVRDLRDNFFQARPFTSTEELNEQVRTWCDDIAAERHVPDRADCTVAAAFIEDKAVMIPLPNDDFPAEEHVQVHVGKTPYLRFDRNDYSVPHTHVCRTLTVIASEERLRVIDPEHPTTILAEHRRSYDQRQQIEDEQHLKALAKEKRHAHQSRGFNRLFAAVPSSQTMMTKLAEQGANLGGATLCLLQLLDRVGAESLEQAVAHVVSLGDLRLRAVHETLDRIRFEAGQMPMISVPITTYENAKAQVRPHALSTYDRLSRSSKGHDDE